MSPCAAQHILVVVVTTEENRWKSICDRIASSLFSFRFCCSTEEMKSVLADSQFAKVLVVVHVASIAGDSDQMESYARFLRAFALMRRAVLPQFMKLITVVPPRDLNKFVGYGDLVTAYLFEPIESDALLDILQRTATTEVADAHETIG